MAARKKKGGLPVWCFVGAGDVWGVSARQDGANLPAEHAPWRLLKSLILTGVEPEENDVQRQIAEHGFACFDALSAVGGKQGSNLG